MNLTRVNIVLGILLAIVASLAIAMRVDHSQPNVEFLPEMKRSPADKAFSVSTVLPDGRTLQPPVAGTIARGQLPLHYAATKEDAIRAGEELKNSFTVIAVIVDAADEVIASPPPAITNNIDIPSAAPVAEPLPDPIAELNASVQRGATLYGIYCACCHGGTGAGDGPVAKRGFPPPPPLTTGKSVQMQDGQLFHILTYGQGSMSSMAAQLNREQRWDAINYVRSLQTGAAQSAPQEEAAPIEDAAANEAQP